MGTRSHIGFRKGNEVRYIYVATDGYNHGKTLKEIGHDACEQLWAEIGNADAKGEILWLDHLFTDVVFNRMEAEHFDWRGLQPTARTPMVAAEPHWSKPYLERFAHTLSGVIKVDAKKRISPFDLMEMYGDEGTAWLYDLDNDMVFFSSNPEYVDVNTMDFGGEIKENYTWERVYVTV